MHEVQAGHLFVCHLRVDAHHLRMIKRGNKSQHVTGGGIIDIAARFVGFGFQGKLQIILLIQDIITQEVYRLSVALNGFHRVFTRIRFSALTPTPENVDFRSKFHAQVDGVHRLLESIRAHPGVVGCERAVFENGITKQVGGRHRDDQTGFLEGNLEVPDNAIPFGGGGVDRDQIVVVEVDAVCSDLRQQVSELDG